MHKRYPILIDKDPDSGYGMMIPDLPRCYTFGDTIADVFRQAVEAIELHFEGLLLDGEPIYTPKDVAFHTKNPDYADGLWKTVSVDLTALVREVTPKKDNIPTGTLRNIYRQAGWDWRNR